MAKQLKRGTGNAYAKRIGVSRQRVSALKHAGKLALKGGGPVPEIDPEESIRLQRARHDAQRRSPSRDIKDLYDAKMAKLEYEKAIGQVIERDQVRNDAFRLGRIIRDGIMGLPDRLAGVLASETDQQQVHAILTKELRQVLEALAPYETDNPA